MRRLRAGRRAGCTPQDVPVARRKTCRLHAARRAGCTPQDVPVARRKTCRLHVARRAGCTPQDVPVARRKTCRERAVCAPCARRANAQVGPAVRSGLSLLAQVSQSSAVGPRAGGGTPGVAPRSTGSLSESRAKHTNKRDASVRESGARARASWPSAPGNFIAKPKHT